MALLKSGSKKLSHRFFSKKTPSLYERSNFETEQLLLEIRQIRCKLNQMDSIFNEAENGEQIETCIHTMQTLEEKQNYFMRELKKRRMSPTIHSGLPKE